MYQLNELTLQKQNQELTIRTFIALGELYRGLEHFDIGLSYLEKAEGLIKELDSTLATELYIQVLNRRAAIFLEQKTKLDSVEYLSLKCIELAKEKGNPNLEAISCNEVGFLYYNLDKFQLAEDFLKRAVSIWDQLDFRLYSANAKVNLARLYLKTNQIDKGVDILLASLNNIGSDWK